MSKDWHRIEQIAGVGFLALITIGCAVVLRPFVTALLWAAILCYVTWPIYTRLERSLRGRKNLAAAVMSALITLVLVIPFAVAGLTFADNIARLAQQVQGYRSTGVPPVPQWVDGIPVLGDWLRTYWQDLYENKELAAQTFKTWFTKTRPMFLHWSLLMGRGIVELALSVLIAFFFYRDGVLVVTRLHDGIQRIAGYYAQHLLKTVGSTIKSVVYGLFGTALAQGIMAGIGFSIAGVPSAFLWALLTFLLSLVPAGPPLVWAPVTIWLFVEGHPGWGIFLGLWGFFCIIMIDNVVRPLLISRNSKLPFVLTLLGVLGGLVAFGFTGIFIGPTLLAVGYSIVQEFLDRKAPPPDAATPA